MPTIPYVNAAGKRISGVTTIIGQNLGWSKGALMYWAWREGSEGRDFRESREKAANAGTICHAMIEAHIHAQKFDSSKYDSVLVGLAETGFLNFLQWTETFHFEPVAVEPHLVSEKYQYGATPDLIAKVNGKLSLPDWKTGNDTYEDQLIQLAAYLVAWEEVHPDQLLEGGFHLLRVGKETASFHHSYWDRYALDPAFEAFLSLIELHRLKLVLKKLK